MRCTYEWALQEGEVYMGMHGWGRHSGLFPEHFQPRGCTPWGQHGITLLRDKDLWYVPLRILEQIQVGHVLYTIWTSISEEREILLAWNSCLRFVFSSHWAYVWIKPDSGSLGCENFLKTSSWVWTTECHTVYPNYDYFAIKRHCIWAIGTNEMQSLQGIVRTL